MNKLLSLLSLLLPLKLRIFIFFRYKQGYFVSFRKPKTFSEKIQRRKLHLTQKDSDIADKFKVRQYVEKRIGGQFLIPLVGVYNQLSLQILSSLPNDSVIKTTHGSGLKHIHFLNTDSDHKQVFSQFNKALNEDYRGSFFGESHYDIIERKVIVEKKLEFEGGSPPDFKFHIFRNNGEVNWILQIDFDRFTNHKRNYYDSKFNLLELQVIYESGDFLLPSKKILNEMSMVAIKLNGEYHYSRVDLYLHERKIYFGEITLTPESGFAKFSSKNFDIAFGKLWGEFTPSTN
jgi:hypothetical protein